MRGAGFWDHRAKFARARASVGTPFALTLQCEIRRPLPMGCQTGSAAGPAKAGPMHQQFTIQEHVRWSDVDRAGIIYYGHFQRFFEIAETELFRSVGLSYSVLFERLDIWLPRVQIHFNFRKPLLLDDQIDVSVYVGRFGNTSIRLNFEVHKDDGRTLVTDGHIVLACVDRTTFKPTPVPSELRERLAPFTATASAGGGSEPAPAK